MIQKRFNFKKFDANDIPLFLTKREMEVATMRAQGLREKEIAPILNIQEKTVNVHMMNARKKLDVFNVIELAHLFLKAGYIQNIYDDEN